MVTDSLRRLHITKELHICRLAVGVIVQQLSYAARFFSGFGFLQSTHRQFNQHVYEDEHLY